MITCGAVTKKYGELTAVSAATFAVADGSICALLGPNGAGKSTLVKILTGLLKATNGTAEVCGISASDPALKKIVGILPESLALFNELTVSEHLELTGAVYKLRSEETACSCGSTLESAAARTRETHIHSRMFVRNEEKDGTGHGSVAEPEGAVLG